MIDDAKKVDNDDENECDKRRSLTVKAWLSIGDAHDVHTTPTISS